MTLKPVRKFTPPAEMVGDELTAPTTDLPEQFVLSDGSIARGAEKFLPFLTSAAPHHDWISYFGNDTVLGPDEAVLPAEAGLFVVTGEFTKLNPARMTVGELIDAKDKLVTPVWYRVA